LQANAARAPHVRGVLGYPAALQRTAQALGLDRPLASMNAPMLSELASVALMAQDRSGVLQLVTPAGDAMRLRLFVPSSNYRRARELQAWLEDELPPLLGGRRWHASGDLPLALAVVQAIVDSQLRSIGWTFAGIAVLLLVALRRPATALVALVPVSVSGLLLFGGMGWAGVPLGVATSMFASLSMGVGIDFALHLVHGYRAARQAGAAHAPALDAAFGQSARAIRWNTLVLCLGLLVLVLSALRPDRSLGVLLAAAVFACWLSTLLFLPRLLQLLRFAPGGLRAGAAVPAPLALAAACLLWPARAPATPPASPDSTAAERLMQEVEDDFRSLPRAVRLQMATRIAAGQRTDRTLWGVVDGDRSLTHILYVFTGPEKLTGLTLLVRDAVDPAGRDSTWMYLPAFERFSVLDARNMRIMVPGTALTHEDARGFVPTDRYRLELSDRPAAPGQVWVTARPRTPDIAEMVGYGSLEIEVDRARRLVVRIEFKSGGGRHLKTYELLEPVRVRDIWLPRRVRVHDRELGFTSDIEYAYWPLRHRPAPAVFEPDIRPGLFLPRLQALLEGEDIPID
jgi:hypothetical protein